MTRISRTKTFLIVLSLALVALGAASVLASVSSFESPVSTQPSELETLNSKLETNLSGTSWQLVKFQDGDGNTLTPDDRAKYTITFGSNGRVSSRVDCNRGGSTWKTAGTNELKFGSWQMSRAKCAAGSLHDKIVTDGSNVRYYELKNGHLFLWGMEAGGYYELEPMRTQRRPSRRSTD